MNIPKREKKPSERIGERARKRAAKEKPVIAGIWMLGAPLVFIVQEILHHLDEQSNNQEKE